MLSHHPLKFGDHRHCGSGDMFLVFKACVRWFYQKYFLFHLKSSFSSRDIQIFVFLAFPLFLPVGHCFRQ